MSPSGTRPYSRRGLVRAGIAGAFVSLLALALCDARGRNVVCGKVGEHVMAGVLYCGYVISARTGPRNSTRRESEVRCGVRHELRQAVAEGLLFGTATALFEFYFASS